MTKPTKSFCCGGTASCHTGPMSKAGRSARAITSTKIWRRYGWTNKKEGTNARSPSSRRRPGPMAEMGTGFRRCDDLLAHSEYDCSPGTAQCRDAGCAGVGGGGAEARRDAHLHDPGGCAAEL